MRYLLLILGPVFLLFCSHPSEKNDEKPLFQEGWVVVSGQILNISSDHNKYVSLRFGDVVLGGGEYYFAQQIDTTNGEFEFRFRIFHPKEVLLDYQDKTLTLFVSQKDSIHIEVNSQDFSSAATGVFPSVTFSGTQPKINEEIIEFERTGMSSFPHPRPEGKSAETFYQEVVNSLQISMEKLQMYFRENASSPHFQTYMTQDLIYSYANDLLYHPFYLSTQGIESDENIYHPNILNDRDFPIQPPEEVFSSLYALHVKHTGAYQFRSLEILNLFEEGKTLEGYIHSHEAALQSHWRESAQEVYHYMLFREVLDKDPSIFTQLWDSIGPTYIKDPNLTAYLYEKRESIKEGSNSEDGKLLGEIKNKNILAPLVEGYKGKAVYLDIWATWCGPCLKEIPSSLELQEQFADQAIGFVYLCLDPDPSQWKAIREQFHMKGDHYYLDADQTRQLKAQLGFTGIPRYVLIDKEGNIVDGNAPRPSNRERIQQAIKELL